MTTPPKEVTFTCPDCEHVFEDWYRPSINLSLDDFDDEYLDQATTTRPECGVKYDLGTLFARRGGEGEQ